MVVKHPIFIVGVPRSGTTLLAAMLASHRNMSCGPETHFFQRIERADVTQLTNELNWPDLAVDFISSIIRRSYTSESPRPLIEKYGLTRDHIHSFLSQQSPSIAAMLSSITETHMQNMGKARWVEKTPDHIKYLLEIRQAFPDARIIRILRDPRDIALSLTKIPWGVQTFFEGLIYWKNLDDKSREFFTTEEFTYSLRFEDLIHSPKEELSKLCDFVGESFDENMLDTSFTGKQLNSRNVHWKEKASQPIDQNRVMVWQNEISQAENSLAEAYLGDRLDLYKYVRKEVQTKFGYVFPAVQLLPKYELELRYIAASGLRFWQQGAEEEIHTIIFLGDPADIEWSISYNSSIFLGKSSLILAILKRKVSMRRMIWVCHQSEKRWTGLSAKVIKVLLTPYRLTSIVE